MPPRSIVCRLGNLWPFSTSAFNPSSVIWLHERLMVCRLGNLWPFSAIAFKTLPEKHYGKRLSYFKIGKNLLVFNKLKNSSSSPAIWYYSLHIVSLLPYFSKQGPQNSSYFKIHFSIHPLHYLIFDWSNNFKVEGNIFF